MAVRVLLLAMLLALLPVGARAEITTGTTPIEVGAAIGACMEQTRGEPGQEHITVQGGVRVAYLFEDGLGFATLQRRVFDPTNEPQLANDPIQPPLALDFWPSGARDEAAYRETLRYALNCFGLVYPLR